MKILIINGPNLNRLGKRNKNHYGSFTLDDLKELMRETGKKQDSEVFFYQSNHEGDLIDIIQKAEENFQGIVINPGALTHYSYALRDALEDCGIPAVEAHISNIHEREEFRRISVTEPACIGQVSGLGKNSYVEAFNLLLNHIKGAEKND